MRRATHAFRHLPTLALASSLALVAGCGGVRGSGVMASETRSVSGFSEVALSGTGDVRIAQSGQESLTIEAEDNLLPLLETFVEDGRLTLRTRPGVDIR